MSMRRTLKIKVLGTGASILAAKLPLEVGSAPDSSKLPLPVIPYSQFVYFAWVCPFLSGEKYPMVRKESCGTTDLWKGS